MLCLQTSRATLIGQSGIYRWVIHVQCLFQNCCAKATPYKHRGETNTGRVLFHAVIRLLQYIAYNCLKFAHVSVCHRRIHLHCLQLSWFCTREYVSQAHLEVAEHTQSGKPLVIEEFGLSWWWAWGILFAFQYCAVYTLSTCLTFSHK